MFLRTTTRKKDGKVHRYWSIVENPRVPGGRVRQRHVLYLGEINSSRERAWRKSVDVLHECTQQSRSLDLFPEDRFDEALVDESVVRLCLSQLRLCRPRMWGARELGSCVDTFAKSVLCGIHKLRDAQARAIYTVVEVGLVGVIHRSDKRRRISVIAGVDWLGEGDSKLSQH